MSNSWLRLWHDMPTDPKWRTIARVSGQPISLVQSVFLHLLVDASRNVTRGHVTVTNEDLASALDVTDDAISSVIDAMQGRVLDGDQLTGWDARQPKREDLGSAETGAKSGAQRKREQRDRERELQQTKQENKEDTQCHEVSRNVTLDKDKDKDKEDKPLPDKSGVPANFEQLWKAYPKKVGKAETLKAWKAMKINGEFPQILEALERQKLSKKWKEGFVLDPIRWVKGRRWEDVVEVEPDFLSLLSDESTPIDCGNGWKDSASGITVKGRSLGIEQQPGEPFPMFKIRVIEASL